MMPLFRRLGRLAPTRAGSLPRVRLNAEALEDRSTPATFTVTDLGDAGAGTLRDAVAQANANPDADTIVFGVSGTIALASEIDITESVTITGGNTITLDGGGATRILGINNPGSLINVTLSGLTFQNADSGAGGGGAIVVDNPEILIIRNSVFTGNSAGADGGALYMTGGFLRIYDTTFSSNSSVDGGGAVYIGSGTLQIEDSVFTGNSGNYGGALYATNLYGGVIRGSTFSNNTAASSGGAIELYEIPGTILIENCEITGNTAAGDGGGLYASSLYYGSVLTIANTTISNNTATDNGGGLVVDDLAGTLRIIDSKITGNVATNGNGGGAVFFFYAESGLVEISGTDISNNTALGALDGRGGGLYMNFDDGTVIITNSTITGNQAANDGGGISFMYSDSQFSFTLESSTVTGNTSGGRGGGLFFYSTSDFYGSFAIRNSTISNNTSDDDGGGVFFRGGNVDGPFEIVGSTISNNNSTNGSGGGAAVLIDNGLYYPLFITDSTISGNTAGQDGGGLFLYADDGFYGGVVITDTTISGNTAGDDGGGIWFYDDDADASLTIEGSTISGNTANGDGGGVWFYSDDGLLVVRNSTISGNTATTGNGGGVFILYGEEYSLFQNATVVFNSAPAGLGGGIFLDGSSGGGEGVGLLSSIVSGNTASSGNDLGGNNNAFYATFSLIGDTTIGGSTGFVDVGFNLIGVDPMLGPLQDNGGPTFTHALLRGSPAINAGFNYAGMLYDQRGFPFLRTFGDETDIGAYEFQLPPPLPIVAGPGAGGGGSIVIYNLDGTVRATVEAFDPSVTGGVRVAVADVNGDGVYDYIAGAGPGAAAIVKVFDGVTLEQFAIFVAFESSFTGGVFVAGGDINGDGYAEVVVSPDQGGGPIVAVYDGASLAAGNANELARFFGIQDPNFRGGARVAVGDVTGDGLADIVVAAGFQGGPRITIWESSAVLAGLTGPNDTPFANFFAFEDTLRNGTYVAVGDIDGDGIGDVIVGGGPGGGPRVIVFSGADLASGTLTMLANFFAGDSSLRDGVPVAVADLNGDYETDIVTGTGEPLTGTSTSSESLVRVYSTSSLANDPLDPLATLTPFPSFAGGVFVG